MESAEGRYQPFSYNLYQDDSGSFGEKLNPGITTTVANTFARYQNRIEIVDRGPMSLLFTRRPPFGYETVRPSKGRLDADKFSIVLGSFQLQEEFFFVSDQFAIITNHPKPEGLGIEPGDYFALFVSYALLVHHIPNLQFHQEPTNCPLAVKRSDLNLTSLFKHGRLCGVCEPVIEQAMASGIIDSELVAAIHRIQDSLANEYRDRPEPDLTSKIDTPQHPPHEVKADFGGPIEWSAGKAEEEQEDRLTQYAERIAAGIKKRGLPAGVDILPDLQDVLEYSDQKRSIEVLEVLKTGKMDAQADLLALIAESNRPSARRLLETMSVAGDPVLASAAKKALEKHQVEPEPTPVDTLPPTPIGTKVAAAMSEFETPPDALGYETYANALGDLITNPDTETPMVIAICAHWGMGKTTLMDYIEKRIESKNEE